MARYLESTKQAVKRQASQGLFRQRQSEESVICPQTGAKPELHCARFSRGRLGEGRRARLGIRLRLSGRTGGGTSLTAVGSIRRFSSTGTGRGREPDFTSPPLPFPLTFGIIKVCFDLAGLFRNKDVHLC